MEDDEYFQKMRSWYFSKEEIADSPSRRDGIDGNTESELRLSYCSFIREIGKRLRLDLITIATAIVFCHRFYIHQSLAKNDGQTIATASIFLASKVEDMPCALDSVVKVAYMLGNKTTADRIYNKAFYKKQRDLIETAERLLLCTLRFDVNVNHAYRPLHDALRTLSLNHGQLRRECWRLINEWLDTTICVQFKPHYVAAATLYVVSKLLKIKLPTEKGRVWWQQFEIAPKPLDACVKQMWELLSQKRGPWFAHPLVQQVQAQTRPVLVQPRPDLSVPKTEPVQVQPTTDQGLKKTEPVLVQPTAKYDSPDSVLSVTGSEGTNLSIVCKLDMARIRETIRKRKRNGEIGKRRAETVALDGSSEGEDLLIEREIEAGLIVTAKLDNKRQKLDLL